MKRRTRALPPYAAEIVAARQRGRPVNLFLYAGSRAWELAERKEHAVVVPDDWQDRDWRWIGGLDGTLVVRGWTPEQTDELATFLVRAGAPLIVALRVVRDGDWPRVDSVHYATRRIAA